MSIQIEMILGGYKPINFEMFFLIFEMRHDFFSDWKSHSYQSLNQRLDLQYHFIQFLWQRFIFAVNSASLTVFRTEQIWIKHCPFPRGTPSLLGGGQHTGMHVAQPRWLRRGGRESWESRLEAESQPLPVTQLPTEQLPQWWAHCIVGQPFLLLVSLPC